MDKFLTESGEGDLSATLHQQALSADTTQRLSHRFHDTQAGYTPIEGCSVNKLMDGVPIYHPSISHRSNDKNVHPECEDHP